MIFTKSEYLFKNFDLELSLKMKLLQICFIAIVMVPILAMAEALPSEWQGKWTNPQNGHSQSWSIVIEDQSNAQAISGKITWWGVGGFCTTPSGGMPFTASLIDNNFIIKAPMLNPAKKCGNLSVEMTRKDANADFEGTFANDWPVSGNVNLKRK